MSSVAVESGMDNCSLIIYLKGNSVFMYVLFSSQKSSKNQEMSLKSSGNNVFTAEGTNDNITGRDNHKHIMKSRLSQYITYITLKRMSLSWMISIVNHLHNHNHAGLRDVCSS